MAKILLVEDDILTAQQASKWLAKTNGHTVETVTDGCEALDRLRLYQYDLVVLDWKLPQMSGIEVCKRFRDAGGQLPVLMLTANASILDKEAGFTVGVDDYLTKPFDLMELSLRVHALLRRPAALQASSFEVGDIRLDRKARQVFKNGDEIDLTAREYSLLELLMKQQGRPLTAEEIVNCAWSAESDVSPGAVKTVVSRLRAKLSSHPESSIIHNLPGRGYCVKEPGLHTGSTEE